MVSEQLPAQLKVLFVRRSKRAQNIKDMLQIREAIESNKIRIGSRP